MKQVNRDDILPTELIDELNKILQKQELSRANHKVLKDLDNLGVYIISSEGKILRNPDYFRLNNAKWYQKLLVKISKKYKNKFIDVKPFKVEIPT